MTQNLTPGATIAQIGSTFAAQSVGAAYTATSGTITTTTSTVTTGNIGLAGNVTVYIFGTYAGVTVNFEASPDNSNWFAWPMQREQTGAVEGSTALAANTLGSWTIDAPGFSFFRVRASAWTSGTANVIISPGSSPITPVVSAITRPRQAVQYTAGYRLASATAAARTASTGALTTNTAKQIGTIYHAAASTRRVQIKFVCVTLHANTVAGTVEFEIMPLSAATAPSGGTTITPGLSDQGDAAAEAACLLLPTTGGSLVNADRPVGNPWMNGLGVTTTPSTASPPPTVPQAVLWDSRGGTDGKDLIMRQGVAEGYAIMVRHNAASTVTFAASIIFTEE